MKKTEIDLRTLRQEECIDNWVNSGCKGTICAVTGFGKTRMAIIAIRRFLNKNPNRTILVIVPTQVLKHQWEEQIIEYKLCCTTVMVINTVIKRKSDYDFLILDEAHRYAAETFSKLFDTVKYKMILALTGTLERLDGKEEIIKKYCPICDSVTNQEAIINNWISKSHIYKVVIDVKDIDEYQRY